MNVSEGNEGECSRRDPPDIKCDDEVAWSVDVIITERRENVIPVERASEREGAVTEVLFLQSSTSAAVYGPKIKIKEGVSISETMTDCDLHKDICQEDNFSEENKRELRSGRMGKEKEVKMDDVMTGETGGIHAEGMHFPIMENRTIKSFIKKRVYRGISNKTRNSDEDSDRYFSSGAVSESVSVRESTSARETEDDTGSGNKCAPVLARKLNQLFSATSNEVGAMHSMKKDSLKNKAQTGDLEKSKINKKKMEGERGEYRKEERKCQTMAALDGSLPCKYSATGDMAYPVNEHLKSDPYGDSDNVPRKFVQSDQSGTSIFQKTTEGTLVNDNVSESSLLSFEGKIQAQKKRDAAEDMLTSSGDKLKTRKVEVNRQTTKSNKSSSKLSSKGDRNISGSSDIDLRSKIWRKDSKKAVSFGEPSEDKEDNMMDARSRIHQ